MLGLFSYKSGSLFNCYGGSVLAYQIQQGKEMVQRMLHNHSQGLRKDSGVSRQERPLYQSVNECIDTVHEWLGHGRGRMDLCEVYMK